MNKNTTGFVAIMAALAIQPLAFAQDANSAVNNAKPGEPQVPAPAAAKAAEPAADRSGLNSLEKTDFDGQGRNVKVVLKEVADLFGFNVNLPDDLDGTVADAYKNITWRDFYSIVLNKKGYVWKIENDIVMVEKKKFNAEDGVQVLESGNINVEFEAVPVSAAVAAICKKIDKNYSPLPAELEGTAAAQPGAQAAAPKVITIRWRGVTWQRTLQEILARYNYGFREEEGIIRVLPLDVLNNIPSETRVYKVNFADAAQVAKTLAEVYKASAPNAAGTLIATAETSQQLVIVTAKPDFLRNSESNILALISQIDQPSKQVIIESRIVEKSWDNNFELGFKYAYGPGPTNRSTAGNAYNGSTAGNPGFNQSSSAATAGGLTTSGQNGTAPFQFVLSEKDFKFFMDALETDTNANVLQNPTVVVKDDGKGAIRIVRREPYFESQTNGSQGGTATQTFTTKFVNIGTSLYLKPKIKGDGYVELKIDQAEGGGALTGGGQAEAMEGTGGLSVSAKFGAGVDNPAGGRVPVTDNRDIRTTVLLKDGYTVALGGLIKDADSSTKSQVPLLGDIPVLGRLFQSNESGKQKLNLMAFITARIIDPFNSDYRDMLKQERIAELGLSSRDIEGASYKISDAEKEALDELLHKRDLDANARKAADVQGKLNNSN